MQQVRVKEIKSKTGKIKTGARAGQDYELIIIIAEDGSEFTTFDTGIKEVGTGGLLELEAEIIRRALDRHGGNKSRTAAYLGVPRHVLVYRIEKYGI